MAADGPSATSGPRLLLVSDLDNTMVDHQDPGHTSLLRFNALWASEYAHDSLLVFSTGRSPTLYQKLRTEAPLLTPGIAITSVGTEILYGDTGEMDGGWEQLLDQGWDRAAVVEEAGRFPQLQPQAESEQRAHKVSFHVNKEEAGPVVAELEARLKARGLRAKLIYSGGYDLDVLPEAAGKGRALAYLLEKLGKEGRAPGGVLACGDSGNDAELFTVEGANGVVVGNAHEELVRFYESQASKDHVFKATERCASGIIQAIKHFGFGPSTSVRDSLVPAGGASEAVASVEAVHREVIQYHVIIQKILNGDVSKEELETFRSSTATVEAVVPSHVLRGPELAQYCEGEPLGSRSTDRVMQWVDGLSVTPVGNGGAWVARYATHSRGASGDAYGMQFTAVLEAKVGTSFGVHWRFLHESFVYK